MQYIADLPRQELCCTNISLSFFCTTNKILDRLIWFHLLPNPLGIPVIIMATLLPNFQPWTFEKYTMGTQHSSPSDSTSGEFFEDKLKITAQDIPKISKKPEISTTNLDETYQSSEEELSPEEMDTSGDEIDEDMEKFRAAIKTAIEICLILPSEKPKIVDIPCPSLTNSPSVQSTASGDSSHGFGARPRTPERSSKRRALAFPTGVPLVPPRRESLDATSTSSSPRSPNFQTRIRIDHSIPSSPLTPVTPNTPSKHSFLAEDPFESAKKPAHQNHSRLRNLSGKFSHLVSRNSSAKSTNNLASVPIASPKSATLRKQKSTSMSRSDTTASLPSAPASARAISTRHISAPIVSEHPPILTLPMDSSSTKRKLVPRGASEREPTLQLRDFLMNEPMIPARRRKSVLRLWTTSLTLIAPL